MTSTLPLYKHTPLKELVMLTENVIAVKCH